MFKNVKKALFAFVLLFVALFAIACGKKEANNENCKEFCEECPTCNNASAETCKDFCPSAPECKEASAETCKKFQDFVAPTSFSVSDNELYVGGSAEVWIDDEAWEPENCDKTLVFVSENPEIATVDADGVVYGHRPGSVNIKVYSPLNPELDVDPVEFEVKDAEKNDQKVVERELAKILAELPAFITEDTELPEAWNTFVSVTYKVAGNPVELLQVPADLAADTALKVAVQVTLNDAVATDNVDVWAVLDANVNTYVVMDSVAALLTNYLAKYVNGEKVAADLELLPSVFGCTISWTSSNATVIATDGKFDAPAEDKNITLDAAIKYNGAQKNISFKVVAKAFTASEKADAIMASTFGKMEGKSFNTSIVLPEFDDKFGAKLSYKSLDTAVYDDSGKLVAAVTEAKDVKFKVTMEYLIAGNAANNFVAERELTIHAVPANAASTFLEAALGTDDYKKYQKVVYAPYGATETNELFPELEGMVWDVEAVKLDARLQDDFQVVKQAAAGAALKLDAQYLRYQLISVKGTYTKDGTTADIVLFFNIGISETPHNIITGIWRSSAQKDTSLSEIQGKYDIAGNVSYFDKKIGYVTESYGSGFFSGWSVTTTEDRGNSLVLAKSPEAADPDWKCAVAEAIEGADYTGINKLIATVQGPAGEGLLLKVNDSKESWHTMDGSVQNIEFTFEHTFDTTKFPMVIFCNPGAAGTGNPFIITKLVLTDGAGKNIDLLAANWRSLDEGIYFVEKTKVDQVWQTFMMELMTVYIREDAEGKIYVDYANVTGGAAGAGGNWGIWYVNTTNKAVPVEVGVYGDTTHTYADSDITVSKTLGSRVNIAMDGYALGFVADSTGKIIHGSNNSKLQNGMLNKRTFIGGTTIKKDASIEVGTYDALTAEQQAKFDAVYKATAPIVFVQNDEGAYKKVTEGETVSYVEIAEGETVAAADRFNPTYAADALLTAEQYEALAAADKKSVAITYKAKEDVAIAEVANLVHDTTQKGSEINYIEIPANGYGMSWKYQFYGVGVASSLYALCQDDDQLSIKYYTVHGLNDMDTENAGIAVEGADTEAKVVAARKRVNALDNDEQKAWAHIDLLEEKEVKFAAEFDKDVLKFVALATDGEGHITKVDGDGFMTGMPALIARYDSFTEDFTKLLTKKAEFAEIRQLFEDNCFVITFKYDNGDDDTTLTYTKFDGAIALPKPEKANYTFLGWFDAEMLVDVFDANNQRDVTLTAKWLYSDAAIIEAIAAAKEAEVVYYGYDTTGKYMAAKDNGTANDQAVSTGFDDIAVLTGGKLFPLGKYSLIELGADATADVTLSEKTDVQVYGTDGTAQFSCGLVMGADKAVAQNSYGHGALYHNAGTFNVTISEVKNTYGRNLGGEGYGYDRFLFHFDDEKKVYVGTKVACADGTSVTLQPGDYFWCPMTAERFGNGLTNCTGASGKVGVWNGVAAPEALFIKISDTKLEKEVEFALDGGLWNYTSVAAIKADFLADYNAFVKADPALTAADLVAKGAWAPVDFDDMIYSTPEMLAKWAWIFDYFEANAGTDTNKAAFTRAKGIDNAADYGKSGGGNDQYSMSYEIRAFLSDDGAVLREGNETYQSTKYTAEVAALVLDYLKANKITLALGATLPTPLKDGKAFAGWYKEEALTNRVFEVGAEDKVYAKWVDTLNEVIVEFWAQDTLVERQALESGAALVAPEVPVLAGFTPVGWSTQRGMGPVELPATATANAKYYAAYEVEAFFDEVTVDPSTNGKTSGIYKDLATALKHINENGTITMLAGEFAGDIEINIKGLTIVGANANTTLKHTDTFTKNAETDTILTGKVSIIADNVTLKGVVIANTLKVYGNENTKLQKIILATTVNEPVTVPGGASTKDLSIDELYATGNAARSIYIYGSVTNLTVNKFVQLDQVAGLYEAIRVGAKTEARLYGKVEIKNSYFGKAVQAGFMDRLPSADEYVIDNNYFFQSANALYFRDAVKTLKVTNNVFEDCGNKATDWDVITLTTGEASDVKINNNCFVDSFKTNTGTSTDYIIKVKTTVGTVDCSKNFYSPAAVASDFLNATGYDNALTYAPAGTFSLECKDVSLWTADYYNNYIYLLSGNQNPTYWTRIYVKHLFGDYYKVVGTAVSGDAAVQLGADYTIAAQSGNTTDYDAILALNAAVGDVITFATAPAEIATGVLETPVVVTLLKAAE